jgi:hypothetical protein
MEKFFFKTRINKADSPSVENSWWNDSKLKADSEEGYVGRVTAPSKILPWGVERVSHSCCDSVIKKRVSKRLQLNY